MTDQLHALHSAWCKSSAQEINYRATERLWYALHQLDFTPDDVRCVVDGMKRFNSRSMDAKYRIQAHKVCGDPEVFASMLAEFRGKERNRIKPPSPAQAIVEQFR